MNNTYHVVASSSNGGWAVIKTGASRALKKFDTKAEAVSYAKALSKSKKTILYVHRKDGAIQKRNSYENELLHS